MQAPAPELERIASEPIAGPHDHLVQFYEHDEGLVDSITHFIGDGIGFGASAVIIATGDHLAQLERAWYARGVDIAPARSTGRYVTVDAQQALDALLVEGRPDAARFASTIAPLVAAAAARGPRAVIFGEMVALLWSAGNHAGAVRLEELWNELAAKHAFTLLCAYPAATMASGPWQAVHSVCAAHSAAMPLAPPAMSSEANRLAEICDLQRRARALPGEIGQRKAAERLLASREHEFEDFLENAAQAIHSVDADGVILWANQFELEMLGYAASDYIGHPIEEFYANPAVAADILRRLRAGETLRDEPAQMRRKDGSLRDVVVTSNVRWEGDAFVQTRCMTRDVTDQLRAERALRESEERADRMHGLLAAIVQSSDDAIISKSLDGCVTSWNEGATRVFGYTAEEAIGKPITLIIPPEYRHEERHILEKIARGERIEHFETVRAAKDGRRVDVSLTISPVRDREGRVVGASKVARDVSDRRHMERQLREADRRKDEFIAVLGHELRNPLAPIRSIAEILRRSVASNPGTEQLCTILERQVAQMTRLLDDLLDVSRITRGKINFRRETLDLVTVVQRAVEASRPLIDHNGHDLRIALPNGPAWVQGDEARLVQMVTNLLNNAARYTPDRGTIELRVARRDAAFEIHVKDNGIGIAAEKLPDVFDLFVQGDRTASHAPEGLGIGLTLVRRIAEHHHGSVSARSTGPGHGSEFVVTIPAHSEGAPPATVVHANGAQSIAKKRILILDDNRDSSESLATLLRLHGHHVSVAVDGASGMQMIESLSPDLALLDIGLPGMTGYEFARRLRGKGCKVQLAALTGYGTAEDRERSRDAGFDHHFVKPIDPAALEHLIASLS
jgi:PAS domain S-box-containing protein